VTVTWHVFSDKSRTRLRLVPRTFVFSFVYFTQFSILNISRTNTDIANGKQLFDSFKEFYVICLNNQRGTHFRQMLFLWGHFWPHKWNKSPKNRVTSVWHQIWHTGSREILPITGRILGKTVQFSIHDEFFCKHFTRLCDCEEWRPHQRDRDRRITQLKRL